MKKPNLFYKTGLTTDSDQPGFQRCLNYMTLRSSMMRPRFATVSPVIIFRQVQYLYDLVVYVLWGDKIILFWPIMRTSRHILFHLAIRRVYIMPKMYTQLISEDIINSS